MKTIDVIIPWEKEYDSDVYREPKECYLAKALMKLGYSELSVNANYVKINRTTYKIEDNLYPARIKKAFDEKRDLQIRLIKLYED